jgi:hypothetical protein
MKTDAGLPYAEMDKKDLYNSIRETKANQILRCRELNGEPRVLIFKELLFAPCGTVFRNLAS